MVIRIMEVMRKNDIVVDILCFVILVLEFEFVLSTAPSPSLSRRGMLKRRAR